MKRLCNAMAFLLSLVLLFGAFSPAVATAAAVPSITSERDGMTVIKGTTENLVFTIIREFDKEKYDIKVYGPSGLEVAYAEGDVNMDTATVELSIPVDSNRLRMEAGKYTVKYCLSYYSGSKWNNTVLKTMTFRVLEKGCSGTHKFGAVQTVAQSTCNVAGTGKATCSVCSYVTFMELNPAHIYSDSADTRCNACGHTRQSPMLVEENGTWKYYDDGIFTKATTMVQHKGNWYYVVDGLLAYKYTGLVKYNGNWYYVVNGKLNYSATTLVKYNNEWWYVVNGKLISGYTGLVKYNGEWWYIVKGKVASKTTTLVKYNGEWWYVVKGKIAGKTTTLVNYNGGWYYILKGKVASKTTTLVKYNGIWYYVANGKVDFGYNGKAYYNYKYYTVRNGRVV